jgi:ribulose-5-phosphate 4-epimerase/fuculose-1-phosphate aldolase
MAKLTIPPIPQFETFEEERHHCKQRLAATFRLFAYYGFDEGVAGNITMRDPEFPDQFWINPFGMYFGHIRVSDLLLVDVAGEVIQGQGAINIAGFTVHSRIHAARLDVVAVAHAHSPYGKTWSTLGRLLDPLNQDVCAFFEDHALFDRYHGIIFDNSEADRLAGTLGAKKALILQNHGLLTVGQTIDETAWWFITLERSCQTQILAEAVGQPVAIEPEVAKHTHALVGSHHIGWFSFQSLYQMIVRKEPDLLE